MILSEDTILALHEHRAVIQCDSCEAFFYEDHGFISEYDRHALFCCEECAQDYDIEYLNEIKEIGDV